MTLKKIWGCLIMLIAFCWVSGLKAQCSAVFQADTSICFGDSSFFQNSYSSSSANYSWNFGDPLSGIDNTDTNPNPLHIFSSGGTFTVTLIVNDTSCSDTFLLNIHVFNSPKADFNYSNGCAGLNTSFTDASTTDSTDAIQSWSWNFGGTDTSTLQNPQFSFTSSGNYSVSLIVKSGGGCSDTVTKNIIIYKKPAATTDALQTCKDNAITFTGDSSYAALSYSWDFGDSSYFTQKQISHIYKKSGVFQPLLTVDYGSTKCTIKTAPVTIFAPPDADFVNVGDTMCFKGNKVCIQLKNPNQKLQLRSVFFDDGFVDDFTPLNVNNVCHSYSDVFGGNYSITVELIDSNNCVASVTKNNIILVHPKIESKFTFNSTGGCFKTNISLTNTSNQAPPKVKKFRWDFGDGNSDSSTWNNVNYTYYKNGSFTVKLIIENTEGCADTFTAAQAISNTSFIVDAHLDSSAGSCRNNNYFVYKQTPIAGASIRWYPGFGTGFGGGFTQRLAYINVGLYKPWVIISKNGCDSTVFLDSVVIHGPQAAIGGFINRFQCQIKDTVYFQNSSVLFRNKSAVVRWDAGDVYGPQCTLNTNASQNIGMNCRYSEDSFKFNHMYQKGKEQCYYLKLVMMDTVLGCADSIIEAIPLMAPQAKGLFYPSDSTPCPGPESYKRLTFNYTIPKPSCLKYAFWVMWDSLAARNTSNFDSCWSLNSYSNLYNYEPPAGDPFGNVTIGLIVENGYDTLGKVCRDTGWFHNVVKVPQMNPLFTSDYDSSRYYCKNSTFHFFLRDSTQDYGTKYFWSFGDGTVVQTTDSSYQTHTYTQTGSYYVHLTVLNPSGCVGDTALWVSVGVNMGLTISNSSKCLSDTIAITELNRYASRWGNQYPYWSDLSRAAAGKETIKYDLGDGNGFQNLGPNPVINFPHPGTYPISMMIKDSMGCYDTLKNAGIISVSAVFADFSFAKDTFLCPQSVKFTSLASTIDTSVNRGLPGDYIAKYDWSFGSQYPKSQVKNPTRYFATGNYSIQMIATNSFGCKDSITKSMVIIGPQAKFEFLSDTVGCEPLLVTFKNQSSNATDYIWQFGDLLNSSIVTKKDTNVSFAYIGSGTFYPHLISRGSFTQNGVTRICDAIYPDTSTNIVKSVTVWEMPKPDFTWITNCATGTTSFTNTTKINSGNIISLSWSFGDGGTSNSANPTHSFADTGRYTIILRATSDHGCTDSIVRVITVSPVPIPWFGYTSNCVNNAVIFKDSTFAFNDRVYLWNWNFGDGGTSALKNPTHIFTKDTIFKVKLKVTNVAGCSDSVTRNITVFSRPVPNFTYKNVCEQTKATFKNTSTGKQAVSNYLWKFGDGGTSTATNPNHIYSDSGKFIVKLIATSVKGCMDSVSKTIQIYPKPEAIIHVNQHSQCYTNHVFIYSDSSRIGSGTTFSKWYFDEGDTSDSSTVYYIYATIGVYPIQLYSVSNFGCRDTAYDTVYVNEEPEALFDLNAVEKCASTNSFEFTDQGWSYDGNYRIKWEWGDGDTASSAFETHHYADSGLYRMRQVLFANNGCTDTAFADIVVYPMPEPAFGFNDSDQCLPGNQFIITNQSSIGYGTMNYSWRISDGTSSNQTNITHSFTSYGNYKVYLTAASNKGCKDSTSGNAYVFAAPKAAFSIDDSTQCLRGNLFTLTNGSSISTGTITHSWDFGDGNNSTNQNTNHSYNSFGNYNIKLKVTSDKGCADSITHKTYVYAMPLVKPVSNFNQFCLNAQNFAFTDSSSIAQGSISRTWKFDDSTTSVLQTVSKTWMYPKTHSIKLVEISDMNCSDSSTITAIVFSRPYAKFSINDSGQCFRGNLFSFTDLTTIDTGTLSYNWYFGDGSNSNSRNPVHNYNAFGNYKVSLVPETANGCKDSVVVSIDVFPMPVAAFNVNDSTQCLRGNSFITTNNSSIANGTLQYSWNFGDGNNSNSVNPSHSYNSAGNFNITFIANSDKNCADTAVKQMVVYAMPLAKFVVNDSDQCLNAQNFIFTDLSSISNGTLSRNWKTDEGDTASVSPWNHSLKSDTTHRVQLISTSNFGCADTSFKYVIVYSAPLSAFTVNDTDQCFRYHNFSFNNSSKIRKGSLTYSWNFGDNKNSNQTSPSHKYNTDGTYRIVLRSTSDKGCIDSISHKVYLHPNPVAKIHINNPSQCFENHEFIYTDSSTISSGKTFPKWYFDVGDTSDSAVVHYIFASIGEYQVQLTSVSDFGCKDTTTDSVFVNPKPEARFGITELDHCITYNKFQLTDSGYVDFGSYNILWKLGDGNTASTNPLNHSYADTGLYTITQILSSNRGCMDSISKKVRVYPLPLVKFIVNDSTQCKTGNQFTFTNNSSYPFGTCSWLWNFGDGQNSNSANPSHSYTLDGIYKVKLFATSPQGCKDSSKATMEVYPMPVVQFSINDSLQCLTGNSFAFTNKSSIKSGSITNNWNAGDGSTAGTLNYNHTYTNFGNYQVKLKVISAFGCSDSFIKPVEVYPMPLVKPRVNQTAYCINGQAFIFTDSSSIAYGSLSRNWSFADSTGSVNSPVNKTFLYPKNYSVKLRETSNMGCADSANILVKVYAKPQPKFSINDSTQCQKGNLFVFKNLSTIDSGSINYNWNFGDGNNITGVNSTHSYLSEGNYLVTLKPTSSNGCTDSTRVLAEVFPSPKASFTMNDSTQCLRGNQFVFSNNSTISGGTMQYKWQFGNNDSSTLQNPSEVYKFDGQYNVRLISISDHLCADTALKTLEVYPMPKAVIAVNDSDQCFNIQNFIFNDFSTINSGSISRMWKADDGASSNSNPWNKNFISDSVHTIYLLQTSDKGCMDSLSKKIIVFVVPKAGFSINNADQCLKQNYFTFSNLSTIKRDTMRYNWYFGDATSSTIFEPSHQYLNAGNYVVQMKVISQNGCRDSAQQAVNVNPMPVPAFSVNDSTQCFNAQNFSFTNSSSILSGNLSHYWTFGDELFSLIKDPNHSYAYDSNFIVRLVETSDKGCMDSVDHKIIVYPKPNVQFSLNDSSQCLRQNRFISVNNSKIKYGTLSFQWTYGNGNSSNASNINYVYPAFGNYNLLLKAVSDQGCTDSSVIAVIVGAMPVPAFTINDAGQCMNSQNFIFTNNSQIGTGTFTNTWHFGDNQTSGNLNASHIYSAPSNYGVKLVTFSNYGCMDSLTKIIRVFNEPNALFTVNDSDQCANQQNYIFTNTSTIGGGKITSILWNLGNGNTDNKNVTGSYYPNSGTYRITLSVLSDSGCTDTFMRSIRVYPKPASAFFVNDSAQCLFQNNYVFTDNSYDSFGLNNYYWNINNESIQSSKIANYVFKTPGSKTITLISSSLRGCSDTSYGLVYVKPMPDPTFTTLNNYYCQGTGPYSLIPVTAGGTFFGKNMSGNDYNPGILWKDTVKYIVTIDGCTDSSSQKTEVYPGPDVNLGNDTTLCKQEFLLLKLNSWSSKYSWSTGNNSPEIRITQPGLYWVTVSNMCGTKTDSINVKFRDINCRFFLPTVFTPNHDRINDLYKPIVYNLDKMDYLIYNRWGQLVFKGDLQSPGWDGTYMNANAQDGVYIIYVNYTYSNGPNNHEQQTASGSFTLVR